ncbi:hypothetical protein [Roseateles microcysteis]|uniref:hypothetical protein n=1 Tax=Roseateles microcysteis TaxID=3119057 RepID=UPI002FE5257E
MPELMLAEMRRYRGWALGLAFLNLAGLSYLCRMTDMAQPNIGLLVVIGGVFVVVGQLLGAWQMWGHSRPNAWMNLLHRPVPPQRLMLSLVGAAALLLVAVVLLPVALALPVASLSGGLVETWQLGLAVQAWLLAMAGYLAAAIALLAPGRWALLMLMSPFLLIADFLALPWLLLPMAGLVLWLLAALQRVFKPDLASMPRGWSTPVLLGLPMVLAVTVLMQIGSSLATQAAMAAAGVHPQFERQPQAGSYEALQRLNPRARLAEALGQAEGRTIDAAQWKAWPAASLGPEFDRMPVRFQPGRRKSLSWGWAERGWRMEYSHAEQVYLAFDNNGRQVARLGRQGLLEPAGPVPEAQRFEQPLLPMGRWLADGAELLQPQPGGQRLQRVLLLPDAQDRFVALPEALGAAQESLLLSNRELLLVDKGGAPRWRLALAHGVRDLRNVEVIQQGDTWLVSIFEGRPLEPSRPWQTLLRVDAAGQVSQLLSRKLKPSFADAYSWIYWMVSPLQHGLLVALDEALHRSQNGVEMAGLPLIPPLEIQRIGYSLLLLSALAGALLARRRQLGLGAGLAWTLVCSLIGLPALLVAACLMRAGQLPAAQRQGLQAAHRMAA